MFTHVDLCSGIGGFALGFERAGLSRPVMFCDIEPWSRKILAKHWPGVPIEEDVKELANEPERIPDCTILTAGYPCQPFSSAGKRRGTEDDRHIWPYIRKIVASKRPTWCVFENVYGHVSLGLDQVLSDLEAEGYAPRTFIVPAAGVDACHKRDRVWIVARDMADSNNEGLRPRIRGSIPESIQKNDEGCNHTGRVRNYDSDQNGESSVLSKNEEILANAESEGLEGRKVRGDKGQTNTRFGKSGWTEQNLWLPEPRVGRVAHGVPNTVDRIRGLGNAIVPQIAMQIGLTIKNLYNQEGETNEEV